MINDSDQISWLLTFASSLACILGSCVIYGDVVWSFLLPRYKFRFQDNPSVLVATLAISSGVLLFTAMYSLMPSALKYLQNTPDAEESGTWPKVALIISFLVGICLSSGFNALIHALTAQSIVHCVHDDDGHHHSHDVENTPLSSNPEHYHDDHDERTPLVRSKSVLDNVQYMSILDLTDRTIRGKRSIGRCMGYKRVEDCVSLKKDDEITVCAKTTNLVPPTDGEEPELYSGSSSLHSNDRIQPLEDVPRLAKHFQEPESLPEQSTPKLPEDEDTDDDSDHHHHVLTEYSHLFTIGMQTALAISVHKIPEGFLTFATTHHDVRVGFNVFVALAVHNFAEGFSIAFPLYLALKKRWLALSIAATLGGLSQPLGGLIAWTLFKQKLDEKATSEVFGWLVGGTAGFMTVIGFQMYGTSIMFGKQQSVTLWWAILGIAIIGFSSSLV